MMIHSIVAHVQLPSNEPGRGEQLRELTFCRLLNMLLKCIYVEQNLFRHTASLSKSMLLWNFKIQLDPNQLQERQTVASVGSSRPINVLDKWESQLWRCACGLKASSRLSRWVFGCCRFLEARRTQWPHPSFEHNSTSFGQHWLLLTCLMAEKKAAHRTQTQRFLFSLHPLRRV